MANGSEPDGAAWVWPEGLSHYIAHHRVLLPDEFMQQALSGESPRLPGYRSEDRHEKYWERKSTESVSLEFWHEWCASRRSPWFVERLRADRLAVTADPGLPQRIGREELLAALSNHLGLRAYIPLDTVRRQSRKERRGIAQRVNHGRRIRTNR